ncbi:NAD(P)-dependent alcohol dehydrogenase [Sphingomonas sp. CROZ-RG-20F-R02-07]|uniref:NAD(P)-dependent alcohol dehydrogenase n=1 Tax=Sphingomonas sp. CROZ-RG-20F-R02-07 TaxID=2914832 RepID=UPI001F585D78|nr:NAD(P)-dependent alcohol dehydrogenase [Sphingomonas sp. CROZ-RG-20F-R02-07]
MRRIEYSRYGGPEELRLNNVEPKAPCDDQISIRVKAASTNPMDWKIRAGTMKMMTGKNFPRGVGTDFAGVVEAVGRAVTRFKVGDAVFGAMTVKESATFADTILTAEDTAAIKPESISFEEAATLPIAGATAWTALIDTAKLQSGQRVLVNGCLGSVGRAAVQIAKVHGAKVVGTCSPGGVAEAQALGVDEAIDYRGFDPKTYRKSFDVVFDTAGVLSPGQCLPMLTSKGVALHINLNPKKMIGVLFTRRNKAVIAKTPSTILEELARLAANGKLKLSIAGVIPLADAIPAITKLEANGLPKGKLVIVP